MRRLADGDRAVFQPVFRALFPRVRLWCERLLGNAHDGEDAAQQALLKLFAEATLFYPDGDVLSWALTLATWECRTHKRRGARRSAIQLPEPSPVRNPEDLVIESDLQTVLRSLVGDLSRADQEVLALVHAEGRQPLSAALRKRRQRALTRLKQLWRRQYGNT